MIFKKIIFIGLFSSVFSLSFAQVKTLKETEMQKAKVDTLYTLDERANMHQWFYNRVNDMQLKEDLRDDYDRIVNKYVFQMSRINDADKNYTRHEIHEKYDILFKKMNIELKTILTTDQYVNHLENFGLIQRSIYNKWNFEYIKN
ncbi:hypothetical protein BZARG_2469 [Bizionia argentinensis JUB59]|uniref:Uncharacterized protein n=1 Tax=Bizionia argentinensis JUB59 TaxID=1046627 RepID=G2ECH3_9FLAO|nr:hypothetical protein [Bizionia argentinensis]EGV43869.1 hypothetical protein BZARG_2469 [Bizionia argentinensis JUB59]